MPPSRNRAPRTETLSESEVQIIQYLERYNQTAELMARDHEARFAPISADHKRFFKEEDQIISTAEQLESTVTRVSQAVLPIVDDTEGLVLDSFTTLPSLLGAEDLEVLADVKLKAKTQGLNSYSLTQALDNASSESVRQAMIASLDKLVFDDVKLKAKTQGLNSYSLTQALDNASSESVRQAMIASLDKLVFDDVKLKAKTQGLNSYSLTKALDNASSESVRQAMIASLDKLVFDDVKLKAKTQGLNSYSLTKALDNASSESVRRRFRNIIHSTPNTSDIGGHAKNRSQESKDHTKYQDYDLPPKDPSASNKERSERAETTQETPKPKQEIVDQEVINMINKAIQNNRNYAWLASIDPRKIRRIVETVKELRARKEKEGGSLSDRQAYLRYRAKSETKPEYTESAQILEALMGGNLKDGKLPF